MRRPRRLTPLRFLPLPAPFKKGTPLPAGRILLPRAPFVSPVNARVPHMLPHRPGVRLTGFLLPEPLLRARLRPTVAVVPLSGERPPSFAIPRIGAKSLFPLPHWCCRTPPRTSSTTGATPPPLDTTARRRLRRLTVDPSFRCAPALSSFPGTFPVAPSRSPVTPCRRRATVKPPVSTPLRRPTRARYSGPRRPFPRWAGLPGRGPASFSADRAWQAAMPRGL
jgi:hypothetical protein